MHFSNGLNFRPLNFSLELWIIFLKFAYPKGCFGKTKIKNSIFLVCLSILTNQSNPAGAPPLSVVKTITELSNIPAVFRVLVTFPTDSSKEATMAA